MRRTIPEVEQKRRQFWFDTAVRGLASQGFERSLSKAGDGVTERCAYRGSEGRKCAVGWLMNDEEAILADRRLLSGFSLLLLNGQNLSIEDRFFLSDLQDAHDGARAEGDLMQKRLVDFATWYGLSNPEELK